MTFLANYGLFLVKTITIVIAIIAVLLTLVALKAKAKASQEGSLHLKKLNEKYEDMSAMINEVIQTKVQKKALKVSQKKSAKADKKNNAKKRIFVMHFDGDIKASAVDDLRETITAVLLTATSDDQVLLCLESPGGMVHGYGLAASQLQRLRDAKIHLVASIDKVAASGGYMMACVANKIIAAPFAIIGSIGVIAQLPNVHRWLEKHDVDFEQITAGQYKRTLTLFGKNTQEGREKLQAEINEAHELFKTFVKDHRANLNMNEIATGEHWFAAQCLDKNLVDKLQTSDDYLLSHKDEYDIYEIKFKIKQSLSKKLNIFAHNTLHQLLSAKN